ncbi:hypothetical protein Cgig2_013706 [Carnegiea gigantea]|uniref:Helicase C-terminal domain-containing protein n=1 Tax=Carnegiea gigantea TaxID=171969 RepID=A0A9Q1QD55_9CARY|nr:hypothetical protein Cgig2_013706 [Carnegiea gigantea]
MLSALELAMTVTCPHPKHPLLTQCSDAHSRGEKNTLPSYDKFDELIDKIDVGEGVEAKFFHNLLACEMFMEYNDSSTEQREMSMDRVNNSPNARVLFGSIKAYGEGISLVEASQIIILDVHFNSSVSYQALRCAFGPEGNPSKRNEKLCEVLSMPYNDGIALLMAMG